MKGQAFIALQDSSVYHIRDRGIIVWGGYYHAALCTTTTPNDFEVMNDPPPERRLCKHCERQAQKESET